MDNGMTTKLELCSLAVFSDGWNALRRGAEKLCAENGLELGIQSHNSTPEDMLERIADMPGRLPMSLHAPIYSETLINLATEKPESSFESLKNTAAWMRAHGVSFAVFHGFIMTDTPVQNFIAGKTPHESSFSKVRRSELCVDETTSINNFFYGSPEWRERMGHLRRNLGRVAEEHPDLTFAIENDFPVYGSGLVLPEHVAELGGHPMCLDVGHLWATCGVHKRDFLAEVRRMTETCNVAAVHLHANPLPADHPAKLWRDGHQSLLTPNGMSLPEVIRLCVRAGTRRFTLEISSPVIGDVEYFVKNWKLATQERGAP